MPGIAMDGVWRFVLAFDPKREAVVPAAATSPVVVNSGSIVNSLRRPTDVSMPTFRAPGLRPSTLLCSQRIKTVAPTRQAARRELRTRAVPMRTDLW